MLDSFLAGAQNVDLAGYIDLQRERLHLIRRWAGFQADYPIILAPVSQEPPFPQNDDQSGDARMAVLLDAQCMQYIVNLLGLPAAAVPTGLHDGVPMGVQLIGPRMREDLCLDAAQVIEDSVGVLARKLWTA